MLTNKQIRDAKPKNTVYRLRDTNSVVRGFGVTVAPSGAKSFFLAFTSPEDGKRKRDKEDSGEAIVKVSKSDSPAGDTQHVSRPSSSSSSSSSNPISNRATIDSQSAAAVPVDDVVAMDT